MSLEFVRKTVREMEGYTPGEQPSAEQRVVKLNTNENPYLPSEKVMRVLRDLPADALRRYPNPTADEFRAAAAQVLGVEADMILAGNGSDDILTIATRTALAPGEILAYPEPTYSLYPVLARLEEAKIATVAWEKDFALPTAALLATGAKAIYLANPNAPTGTMVPPAAVGQLADAFAGLLLVDEAYVDFADDNCLGLVRDHGNVVISRTLSKSYSLAGLRFGFAVAQPQVIHEMRKVKDSYNCDAVSIALATAAIGDQAQARQTWQKIRGERQRVSDELNRLHWNVLPSQANFVLATCPDGCGREAYLALKSRGILVRFFDLPGLRDKLRITIGTPAQNDALLMAIRAMGVA
jgi:histidinol-phosphate aminotransferase